VLSNQLIVINRILDKMLRVCVCVYFMLEAIHRFNRTVQVWDE